MILSFNEIPDRHIEIDVENGSCVSKSIHELVDLVKEY